MKQLLPFVLLLTFFACEKDQPNTVNTDDQSEFRANSNSQSSSTSESDIKKTTHGTLEIKNSSQKCFAIIVKNTMTPIQVAAGQTHSLSYPIGTYTYSRICGFDAGKPGCCNFTGLLKNDLTFEVKANEKTFVGGACR
jgi:hypothetical protein